MALTVEAEGLGQDQDQGPGQEIEIQEEAGLAHRETRILQGKEANLVLQRWDPPHVLGLEARRTMVVVVVKLQMERHPQPENVMIKALPQITMIKLRTGNK